MTPDDPTTPRPPTGEPIANLPRVPTATYQIRRQPSTEASTAALEAAVATARQRGLGSWVPLDTLLGALSPWDEQDILRALLFADAAPDPTTQWGLAFIPTTAEIEARWYVLQPATAAGTPCRVVVVALRPEDYAILRQRGLRKGYVELVRRLAEHYGQLET